jgi:hypothetical protein
MEDVMVAGLRGFKGGVATWAVLHVQLGGVGVEKALETPIVTCSQRVPQDCAPQPRPVS